MAFKSITLAIAALVLSTNTNTTIITVTVMGDGGLAISDDNLGTYRGSNGGSFYG